MCSVTCDFIRKNKRIALLSKRCLSCVFVSSLQPCGQLLGKGLSLGSIVCDVFLWFCHFPMWRPRSGVVLDCIDSRSYLLCYPCKKL